VTRTGRVRSRPALHIQGLVEPVRRNSTPTSASRPAPAAFAWLQELGNAAVDLLFPPCCVSCQRLGAWLCTRCVKEIEVIHPPVCPVCGLPMEKRVPAEPSEIQAESPPCCRCQQQQPQLDGFRAYAFHSGPLREAIHQFKYEDLRSLAGPLGALMAAGWATLGSNLYDPDVIVPVPLHVSRQRQRGYNQAGLLARELGRHLHQPVFEKALVRARATAPQVGLSAKERRANVHDAFRCVSDSIAGRRVLLIDDVFTTGSTLEAACRALRDRGASSVWGYTLARARPAPGPGLR
jgi:ComF family protein